MTTELSPIRWQFSKRFQSASPVFIYISIVSYMQPKGPIETEGSAILSKFCEGFPLQSTTGQNHVLPPYFLMEHPEARDQTTNKVVPKSGRTYTKKQTNQLQGTVPNFLTLFPRIHWHAVIYETGYFWKWTSGFGYTLFYKNQIISLEPHDS